MLDAAISIDLGGTKCAAALIDIEGAMQKIATVQYGDLEGDAVGDVIVEMAERMLEFALSEKSTVTGLGISVPGIVYGRSGKVWAPNIGGWEDYPLKERFKNSPSLKGMDVHLESDRGCSILGECWQGAAKGTGDAVFLAVGTGIGAGIMVNGTVLRGSGDIAGAVGWMALQRPFQEKLKSFGCFEYYASGDGLVRAAKELGAENTPTSEAIFDAYEKGDATAVMVLEQAIQLWGMACANLVSLFNPEIIVFGGGVFGPAARFLDRIYDEASRWAQPVAIRQVRFLPSQLQGRAPLYGAAFRVFNDSKKIRKSDASE